MSKKAVETCANKISPPLSKANADNIVIRKYVHDELEKRLTISPSVNGERKQYKTSNDLKTEYAICVCHSTAADIFNNCLSIQRVIILLKGYNKLVLCNGLSEMASLSEILSCNGLYTATQIMNDFLHIKDHMENNPQNMQEIAEKFRNELKCVDNKYKRLNASQFKDNEDNIFDQQCQRIYSYVTKLEQYNIPSKIESTAKFKHYVGAKEDNTWFNYTAGQTAEDIYIHLVKNMGIFHWQSSHGFDSKQYQSLMHLKPKYKNVKEEVLSNKYYPLSKDNWNTTLRKATIFHSSYARQRIQASYNGKYDDRITNEISVWRKGDIINMPEIVTLKLYTDFDKLQFELKKCYRFGTMSDIFMCNKPETKDENESVLDLQQHQKRLRLQLEERLCIFYWWRIKVLATLSKYSQPLDPQVPLYHGVNTKMILNNQKKIFGFCGPLSTSSSYQVAKTFATAKGMVLEITTQFPGLGLCRAFDVSLISDYPEEKEQLLSFAYLRVTKVLTMPLNKNWKTFDDIDNSNMNSLPLASMTRSIFFAVHLFLQGTYSMSVHSEYWLSAFLYLHCNYNELDDNKDNGRIKRTKFVDKLLMDDEHKQFDECDDLSRYNRILSILNHKFNNYRSYPNRKQIVKIDRVSENLKPYFMDFVGMDIHAKEKYVTSIPKIIKIFPNAEEIHFINPDVLNNDILKDILVYLQKHNELKLRKIKFLCYDSSSLNESVNVEQLLKEYGKSDDLKWKIKDKHIPQIGYEITIVIIGK